LSPPTMNAPALVLACLVLAPLMAACGSSPASEDSGAGATQPSSGGSGLGGDTTQAQGGSGLGGANGEGGSPSSGGTTDDGPTPPSCQSSGPGLTDCGAEPESCCRSPLVPGGAFFRTYDNDGTGATNTAAPATISDFRLDKYPVTVGRYRKFVEAWDGGSGYTPAVGSGKHGHLHGGDGLADSGAPGSYETGWTTSDNDNLAPNSDNLECQSGSYTWTRTVEGNENLPINCVNWWEAYAFCIWDGGFLPSEAEYVYAAAGGTEQRRYPWGSTPPAGSQDYAIYDCNYPDGPTDTCEKTVRNIAPVGTARLGNGRWGHLDLVGNLMAWYLDWFSPSYVSPCEDCAYLAEGSGRAPRDGYFTSTDENLLLASYRNNGFYPTNRFYSFGFRCARAP
jgi:formylglycine-generating enzyme